MRSQLNTAPANGSVSIAYARTEVDAFELYVQAAMTLKKTLFFLGFCVNSDFTYGGIRFAEMLTEFDSPKISC